jgi:DNA polymerase-1
MTKKKKQTLLIIDAHALIHRAFHALPPLTSPDGQPVNAVYGFLLLVLSALREIDPQYVAIAFDAPGKTFRHEFFKDYKANRAETVPELISQFPIVHEVVEEFGFLNFSLKGYEADDLIGTICRQYDNDGSVETIILTGDMDLLQLVDRNTKLLKPMKGVKETMLFDEALVKEKYGITPKQIIDYKGLRGDTSDNIPGVKGIGEKGATELLQKFDSVEGVYKHLEDITGRNRKALEGQEDQALLSKRLATIAFDAPIDFTLESSLLGEYNHTRIQKLFQKYGFKTLFAQLNRLPGFEVKTGMFAVDAPPQTGAQAKGNDKLAYTLADTSELQAQLVKELQAVPIIAFDTETTGLDPLQSELVGVSVSGAAGTGWYVPCPDGVVPTPIKNLLENDKLKKTGHNVKFDIKVLHHAGVQIAGVTFDTMIASFILNSASRGHGLDYLAFTECGHQMQPIEELIGKGKNQVTMKDVP